MNRLGTCFLALITGFGLCGWAFAESSPAVREIVLEEIAYTDEQAAQQVWRASERTPPIRLIKVDGGQALEIALLFARQGDLPRSIHDRDVKLDLSRPGEFILEVEVTARRPSDIYRSIFVAVRDGMPVRDRSAAWASSWYGL